MAKNTLDLFQKDEYDFYQLCVRYNIMQYIPELFQTEGKDADQLRKKINRVGKVQAIANKIGIAGDTTINAGSLLMLNGLQRDFGKEGRSIYMKLNAKILEWEQVKNKLTNTMQRPASVYKNNGYFSWGRDLKITLNNEQSLLNFLNLIVQTDIALKPLGYILARKLEQYIFWKNINWEELQIEGDTIPEEKFGRIQKQWERFKQQRTRWITAERAESMDGFAQENIFRCLHAIQKQKKIWLRGKSWLPVRVWIQKGGWLYRGSIPYLAARCEEDMAVSLQRLDTADFAVIDKKMTHIPEWISQDEIRKSLFQQGESICMKGTYFYTKDQKGEYIRGKLGLNDDMVQKEELKEGVPDRLPYTSSDTEICGRHFCAENEEINPVEYCLLMRSCGEFARFEALAGGPNDLSWKSTEEWKKLQFVPQSNETASEDRKRSTENGIINSFVSFDSICTAFSCMRLAEQPQNTKSRTEAEKKLELNKPSIDTDVWYITLAEMDWLNCVLQKNEELTKMFHLEPVQKRAESLLGDYHEKTKYFLPSKCCERTTHEGNPRSEAVWNQDFEVIPKNSFYGEYMKLALKCVKEGNPISYQYKAEENISIKSLIFPYQFQITKNKKVQLLAYDLQQFRLLDINSFGNNLYKDIQESALAQVSQSTKRYLWICNMLSFSATQLLKHAEIERTICKYGNHIPDLSIPPEEILAAREIVYYYQIFCKEKFKIEGDSYKRNILLGMVEKIKTTLEEKLDDSVFSDIVVGEKQVDICSRMIMGDKLWGNKNKTMKKWSVEGWLEQYKKIAKKDIASMQTRIHEKTNIMKAMKEDFCHSYQDACKDRSLDEDARKILEGAFSYYYSYLQTYNPENFPWTGEVYHSDQDLYHMYLLLKCFLNVQRRNNQDIGVADDKLKQYIDTEICALSDAKQCTALLRIEDQFTPEKLDLIYHIFNEFKLEPLAIVCDPEDLYSEDASKFEMVRCIKVTYPSYSFRKLHEGILALQDFIEPLGPKDLKDIIATRIDNTKKLYQDKGADKSEKA